MKHTLARSDRRIVGLALAAVLVLALNTFAAAPAGAAAAAGLGTTTGVNGRSVSGAGTFALQPIPGTTEGLVTLECSVYAEPAIEVVSTFVDVPSNDGCVLYKGTTRIASAPGTSRNSPAWASTSTTQVSLTAAGAFRVCWRVGARFSDTSSLVNSDCGTSPVPNNVHTLDVTVTAAERNGIVTVMCQAVARPDGFVTSIRDCDTAAAVSNPGPYAQTSRTYAMRDEIIDTSEPTPLADVTKATESEFDVNLYNEWTVCYAADALFVDGVWQAKSDCVRVGLTPNPK